MKKQQNEYVKKLYIICYHVYRQIDAAMEIYISLKLDKNDQDEPSHKNITPAQLQFQ